MKKIFFVSGLMLMLFGAGCQKTNKELIDKIAKLEERVGILEKSAAQQQQRAQQPKVDEEQLVAHDLPIGSSYVMGNPNAPVTLVKFSDYQCPFCARAHDSFVDKIVSDPALKDKVKVVFKHFPLSFHKAARPASKAALAAGEQGHDCFWEMTKKLYAGQKELTDENFKKWAGEITCRPKHDAAPQKMNAQKFWTDYTTKDANYEKMIKDDWELGNKYRVRGTPSFFLNGWQLKQRSVEAIKQLIEEKKMIPEQGPA